MERSPPYCSFLLSASQGVLAVSAGIISKGCPSFARAPARRIEIEGMRSVFVFFEVETFFVFRCNWLLILAPPRTPLGQQDSLSSFFPSLCVRVTRLFPLFPLNVRPSVYEEYVSRRSYLFVLASARCAVECVEQGG